MRGVIVAAGFLLAAAASLCAATPVVTSFTASSASVSCGAAITLNWTASNAPTSVTITPGTAGSGTYINSTTPAAGSATFTPPCNARVRIYGDSIACGFRLPGAAQNTSQVSLPCSPNPNPNGSLCCSIAALLTGALNQLGLLVQSWSNNAVVGTTVQANTGNFPVCSLATHNPDVVFENYGANDLTAGRSAAQIAADKLTWWNGAIASGCTVVTSTTTPRAGAFADTVRTAANSLVITNANTAGVRVVDIGGDAVMGCVGCNTTDTTDFNSDGTHFTAAGTQRWAVLALPVFRAALRTKFTITATNASGTSAVVSLSVPVAHNDPGSLVTTF